jgi:hypothetical protein
MVSTVGLVVSGGGAASQEGVRGSRGPSSTALQSPTRELPTERRAERQILLQLAADRGEHVQVAAAGLRVGGRQHRRLADPGRPLDQHRPAVPRGQTVLVRS